MMTVAIWTDMQVEPSVSSKIQTHNKWKTSKATFNLQWKTAEREGGLLRYWNIEGKFITLFHNFLKNFPIISRILYVFNAFFIFLRREKVAKFVTILPNFL